LPLAASRPSLARTIGVLAPLKIPEWLGASPIGALTLGNRRHVGAEVESRLLPQFMASRGRRRLVIYQGGRLSVPRGHRTNAHKRRLTGR
jgi:hypothetical protein